MPGKRFAIIDARNGDVIDRCFTYRSAAAERDQLNAAQARTYLRGVGTQPYRVLTPSGRRV